MENKSDKKGILLVVFIVMALLLAGFIVYDKLLKKETCNCPKDECKCEKCTTNDSKIDTDYENNYSYGGLSSKYRIGHDGKSYLQFNVDGSWTAKRNECEFYDDISGTYEIKNEKIILKSSKFDSKEVALDIVSGDGEGIYVLYQNENDENKITGCSLRKYLYIENK